MVATPDPERVPSDGVRWELPFSSWAEPLWLDRGSGLVSSGDDADGWRVGVVGDGVGVCGCVCELKSTQT